MTPPPAQGLHFSVDVEDYVSLIARDCLGVDLPVAAGVDDETRRVLDLLDETGVTATCFVVGRLAAERPGIVRELVARGHEVASHGHEHLWMPQLTPATFEADLRRSIATLEDVTGQPIRGFRAPAFSLRAEHAWAFPILAEAGITVDSSVHLVWPFGLSAADGLIRTAEANGIRELPGFALGWRQWRVPVGGGGGLRLVPGAVTRWAVRRIVAAGHVVPVYVHPYDLTLDPAIDWPAADAPRQRALRASDLSQRAGRGRVADRFRALAALAGTLEDAR